MSEPVEAEEHSQVSLRSQAASRTLRGPVAGQFGGVALGTNGNSAYEYRPGVPDPVAEEPWISVVIPNFNRVDTLKSAIESVLTQDYPNIECIVVDAASTDGTIELLKSYGERITWISRPDRGAFDAINDGWKMSKGEILAWVNSDDIWDEGAAQFAADYFTEHPDIDVLYGACGAIDGKGRLTDVYPPRSWDLYFALENCDHIINQTASFMRREIIERVGFLYPAWCHDHDLWLRIAAAGGTFGNTHVRLGSARIWPDNLGNNPKIIVPGKVGLTKRFFATPGLPNYIKRLKRRAISNSYLRCMFYVSPRQPKNWLVGAKLMAQAILSDPFNIFYLFGQVGGLLLRFTPIPGMVQAMLNLVRGVARVPLRIGNKLLVRPAVTITSSAVSGVRHLPLFATLRALAPAIALLAAAAFVFESDLSGVEAAESFALITVPLLAALALNDWRNRVQ